MNTATATPALVNPFPGLRPFMQEEADLFFGRDRQSDELVRRLARKRFLAVVGTSGSGKSSLVRAGLLPSLEGGFMAEAGAHWLTGDPASAERSRRLSGARARRSTCAERSSTFRKPQRRRSSRRHCGAAAWAWSRSHGWLVSSRTRTC